VTESNLLSSPKDHVLHLVPETSSHSTNDDGKKQQVGSLIQKGFSR